MYEVAASSRDGGDRKLVIERGKDGDEAMQCSMCKIIYFQTMLVVYSCLGSWNMI